MQIETDTFQKCNGSCVYFDMVTATVHQAQKSIRNHVQEIIKGLSDLLACNLGQGVSTLLSRFDHLHETLHATPQSTVELDAMSKFVLESEAEAQTLHEELKGCQQVYDRLEGQNISLADPLVSSFWRALACVPRLQVLLITLSRARILCVLLPSSDACPGCPLRTTFLLAAAQLV
jgi:hypothetical protein